MTTDLRITTFTYPGFSVIVEDIGKGKQPWSDLDCYRSRVTTRDGAGLELEGTFSGSRHDYDHGIPNDPAEAARMTCEEYASYFNDPEEFLSLLVEEIKTVADLAKYAKMISDMDNATALLQIIAETPESYTQPD